VELTGSSFSHLALEDQADPVRPAQVEIIRIKASTKAQPCSGSWKTWVR
jgi:hypothetical protein